MVLKVVKNKWKILFFILLVLNVVSVGTLLLLFGGSTEDIKPPKTKTLQQDEVNFHITTNKKDLNALINHYLDKEGLTGPIDYDVILADEVEFYGSLLAFGREFKLKMTFEPEALRNGDLLLKQKSIELGEVRLPASYIMNFIKKQYKTPIWVKIDPKNEQIYVSLQELKLKSNTKIKVKQFDLPNNKISFELLVPTK